MSVTKIYSDQSRRVDWNVREDTDATLTLTVTLSAAAYDLSTYTFIAEFFKVGSSTAFLTLTQGSGITNGGATGIVTIALTDTQLNLEPNEYFWKLRTTAPTDNLWLNGKFIVNGYLWDGSTDSTASIALTIGGDNLSVALTIAEQVGAISLTSGLTLSALVGKLGGTPLSENTSIEGAGLYGLTLGHLTDIDKQLSSFNLGTTGDATINIGGNLTKFVTGAVDFQSGVTLLLASTVGNTFTVGSTSYIQGATAGVFANPHSFTPNATRAGLRVGSLAGNPSTLGNGDLWYNSSSNELNARINGATVALGSGSGGITGSGTAGQITYWSGASAITGSDNHFWDNTNIILYVGANSGAFTNTRLHTTGTVNSYIQNNIRNLSSGVAASGDFVCTADNGTDSTLYGDFGINSSGWSGTGVLDAANTVYLYSKNAPLAIGTDGSTNLVFFTGGTASSNERLRITSSGSIIGTLPVTTGTGSTAGMQLVGNSITTGNLLDASTNSLTSGKVISVTSTSTAINHTAGTSALISAVGSGANSTNGKTIVGIHSVLTNTGTTSTNIAQYLSASGATSNFALIVPSTGGNVGIGTLTPTIGRLEVNGNSSGYIQVWRDGTTLRAYMTDAGAFNIPSVLAFSSGSGSIGSGAGGTLSFSAQSTTYTQNAVNGTHTFQTFTQSVHTGGSPVLALFTGGAHTTLAASAEATDINFNLARTVQFATGALTTQRAFRIQAPTYAFVGASTLTTAATLAISNAPQAGTNATITNSYALLVEAGKSKFGGNIELTQTVTTESVASDTTVTILINGTTYKLLARA